MVIVKAAHFQKKEGRCINIHEMLTPKGFQNFVRTHFEIEWVKRSKYAEYCENRNINTIQIHWGNMLHVYIPHIFIQVNLSTKVEFNPN